jgi:hypothetical protein
VIEKFSKLIQPKSHVFLLDEVFKKKQNKSRKVKLKIHKMVSKKDLIDKEVKWRVENKFIIKT